MSATGPHPVEDVTEEEAGDVAYFAEVGARIRQRRVARGWTQEQLGTAAGLSRSIVAQIEAGDPTITLRRLRGVAGVVQCSVGDLLPDSPAPAIIDTAGPLSTLTATADDPAGRDALRLEVARRVRAQRSYLGLSQDDLARRAGLTRNYVSAIERASCVPDAHRLLRLARGLHTTLGWLLNDPAYHRPIAPFDRNHRARQ